MIKQFVNDPEKPVRYEKHIYIQATEYQRINALFNLDYGNWTKESLSECLICKGDTENILCVTFEDGATLDVVLHYGDSNCYDDVQLTTPDGKTYTLDCCYKLDSMELETNNNKTYAVTLEIVYE